MMKTETGKSPFTRRPRSKSIIPYALSAVLALSVAGLSFAEVPPWERLMEPAEPDTEAIKRAAEEAAKPKPAPEPAPQPSASNKKEQEKREREKREAEKREQERVEREKKEADKKEQKRIEKEKKEAEKKEQERLKKEKKEQEKRDKEKKAQEKKAGGAAASVPAPAAAEAPAQPEPAKPVQPAESKKQPEPAKPEPVKPDAPAKPAEPVKPEPAAKPAEPAKSEPVKPEPAAKPAEPAKSEPVKPEPAAKPAEPVKTEPVKPEPAAKPAEPAKSEPAKPDASAKPAEPAKSEPVKPEAPKPAEPAKTEPAPSKPAEPAKSEAAPKPSEPAKSDAASKPAEPAKADAAHKPAEPAKAAEPAKPAKASTKSSEPVSPAPVASEPSAPETEPSAVDGGTDQEGPKSEPVRRRNKQSASGSVLETGKMRLGIRAALGIGGLGGHQPAYLDVEVGEVSEKLSKSDVFYELDDNNKPVYLHVYNDNKVELGSSLSGGVSLIMLNRINDLLSLSCELQYSFYVASGNILDDKAKVSKWPMSEVNVELHYLEIPVLLRINAEEALGFPIYGEVGPQFGFNVYARRTECEDNALKIYKPNSDIFAIGPVIGAGIDLDRINIGLRTYFGLTTYQELDGGRPWSITLGLTSFF